MKKFFDIDIVIPVVLIFIFISIIGLVPINYNLLDPVFNAVRDFELNDVAFSKIRNDWPPDTNIVIVNIGHNTREQIARQIRLLSRCDPKVIAVDVFFRKRKSMREDSALISAIRSADNIVLAGQLQEYDDDKHTFGPRLGSSALFGQTIETGFVNLTSDRQDKYHSIRDFSVKETVDDTVVNAFATEIVRLAAPDKYAALGDRGYANETINYRGNFDKFTVLDVNDFSHEGEDYSVVRNKIVILGYLGDRIDDTLSIEDKYFTPLNARYVGKTLPDMFGVVIHANIVSMILHDNFIHVTLPWLNFVLAFIVCYCSLFMCAWLQHRFELWWEGLAVFIILLVSACILVFDMLLFIYCTTSIDTTVMIVAIVFAPNALQIYTGMLKSLGVRVYSTMRRFVYDYF